MNVLSTSKNGLAGAISSAIAPVLSEAQTNLVQNVNDTFSGTASPMASSSSTQIPISPGSQTPNPYPNLPRSGIPFSSNTSFRAPPSVDLVGPTFPAELLSTPTSAFAASMPSAIARGQAGAQYTTFADGGKTEARAVQNQGRGPDTMLVHMSPNEVRGLQQLAVANGGSLTTNPETGLPEAGFLDSILPTVLGIGLAATGMTPLAAGLAIGGIQTVRTGDLGKGLMAGLGAYGGAGLGGAASSAGAAAGQQAATQGAEAALYDQALGGTAVAPAAYTAPTTFTGNLAQMGRGVGALASPGGYGSVARTAAMESLKGNALGAMGTTGAALAGPLTYVPPYEAPEEDEVVYEGPYLPTEREARFPGKDRDPRDSSEFLYFEDSNPYPGFYPTNPMQPDNPNYASGFAAQYGPQNMYQFAEGGGIEKDYGFGAPPPMPANLPTAAGSYDEFMAQTFAPQTPVDPSANLMRVHGVPGQFGLTEFGRMNPALVEAVSQGNQYVGQPGDPLFDRIFTRGPGAIPVYSGSGREPPQDDVIAIGNEPMQPGLDAMIGRSFHQNPLAHAIIPGGILFGEGADRSMAKKGMVYDPISSDYANRDYVGGGSKGYENLGQEVDPTGRGNTNPDKDADPDETYFAYGGQVDMHNNGFVVDAKTVAEVGNGSSNAGMERFAQIGGQPIMGPGDGVSDSIPANIDGVQPAMVARDEVYMPPNAVKAYGGGSLKMGEKKLYALMDKAKQSRKNTGRGQKTGLKSLVG